jgi:cytochrome c2
MPPWIRLAAAAALLALATTRPVLAQAPADDPLPDGPGKDAVVRVCTACHDATQFAYARHTPEEWDNEITKMQSAGAEMTPEDQAAVSAYLSRTFPKAAPPPPASDAPAPPTR